METIQQYKLSKNNLVHISKKLIPDFQYSEHTDTLYTMICEYINQDPNFEKRFLYTNKGNTRFSLKKGLFLISAPGAGKSFVFEDLLPNLFKYFPFLTFRTVSTYKLQDMYLKYGASAIAELENSVYKQRYDENRALISNSKYHLYLDDLGREIKSIKFFGNDLYFMDMFIDERVRKLKQGFITHGSSNLNLAELKAYYSSATFSRMYKLFNFIVLDSKIDYRMI